MSAAESAMFAKLAERVAQANRWTRVADKTGWPRLERGVETVAKVLVRGRTRYELWRGHTSDAKPPVFVREVTAAEVTQAQRGEWTP